MKLGGSSGWVKCMVECDVHMNVILGWIWHIDGYHVLMHGMKFNDDKN